MPTTDGLHINSRSTQTGTLLPHTHTLSPVNICSSTYYTGHSGSTGNKPLKTERNAPDLHTSDAGRSGRTAHAATNSSNAAKRQTAVVSPRRHRKALKLEIPATTERTEREGTCLGRRNCPFSAWMHLFHCRLKRQNFVLLFIRWCSSPSALRCGGCGGCLPLPSHRLLVRGSMSRRLM